MALSSHIPNFDERALTQRFQAVATWRSISIAIRVTLAFDLNGAGRKPNKPSYQWLWFVGDCGRQVAKRLERTAGQFKRLGSLGFWGQLVCTVVSAVILAFSVVITGQPTAPVSIYLTAGGIAAAFVSVFWSFGYIRLAQKLRDTIGNPTRVPFTSFSNSPLSVHHYKPMSNQFHCKVATPMSTYIKYLLIGLLPCTANLQE